MADPAENAQLITRAVRRIEGVAAIKAGGTPAPTAVARNVTNPRAALQQQDRPSGIVVEMRKRGGKG